MGEQHQGTAEQSAQEIREASSARSKAWWATVTPEQRAEMQRKRLATRATRRKERQLAAETGEEPPLSAASRVASSARCPRGCPFVDQVVERVTQELLAILPTGQDKEAQRLAVLAVKMARTPSRNPKWYDAVTALQKEALDYAQRHPALRIQVDREIACPA